MLIYAFPFTIISLLLYNIFGLGLISSGGAAIWQHPLHIGYPGDLTLTSGELMLIVGLVFLFIELIKSTRTTAPTIIDHGTSMVVFIVYLIEFIVVGYCATGTFLILMLFALTDVVAGFTITIRGSRRDYAVERDIA
jgi:hypothetical protein